MNPAEGVIQDIELSGIITDNNHAGIEAVRDKASDQSSFGGYPNMPLFFETQ